MQLRLQRGMWKQKAAKFRDQRLSFTYQGLKATVSEEEVMRGNLAHRARLCIKILKSRVESVMAVANSGGIIAQGVQMILTKLRILKWKPWRQSSQKYSKICKT